MSDLREISYAISGQECALLTTEKDMVRLSAFSSEKVISEQPWFYLPVEIEFLERGEEFNKLVKEKVNHKLRTNADA
jgi:tetraacyldisaccharide-1-P 4'-kinase